MVKSVVATGKVEPITKIEIKSKANGIIKVLNADIDRAVNAGDILVELDREQLAATLRGAEANLQAARASLEGAEAQLKKNIVEAEGPDEQFARRAYERAQTLYRPAPHSAVGAGRRAQPGGRGGKPQTRRSIAAGHRARQGDGGPRAGRAGQGRRRSRCRGRRECHAPRADSRHGSVARCGNRQPGLVDPQPRRQRDAGHDARRHRPGVRARQGRRSRHRPRAPRSGRPASAWKRSRTRCSTARSRKSRRWASKRTTSPTSRCACRSTTRAKSSRRT